jgi:nucleotide-binding universal stress UspA family protein
MYQRILLPLDSSVRAEAAIPHAQAAALAYGASIHLLQVVDTADLSSPLLRHTIERIETSRSRTAQQPSKRGPAPARTTSPTSQPSYELLA